MPPLSAVDGFAHILRKCKEERSQVLAARLCGCMYNFGLEAHGSLGNLVIPMLMEVGSMFDAHKIFDKMTAYNECSWNSLIVGYVKSGKFQRALITYQELQAALLHPNEYALAALLKACAELMELQKGYEIHTEITTIGLLECDLFVGNTLVDMYVKVGFLADAHAVFNALPVHDVVSWNVLITGYVKHDRGEEALNLFNLMQLEGTSPNFVTFVSSVKACSIVGAIHKGQALHAEAARVGFLQRDIVVGNALVDMYANCSSLAQAREVFDNLVVRDVISWNTLMSGYAKHEYAKEVLHCFEQMQLEGVFPDAVTLVCGLKASGIVDDTNEGRKIHTWIAAKGLLERDLVVGNALLDMYATCGSFEKAEQVFCKLLVRSVVSWTALIAAYVEHDRHTDAFLYFDQMQHEGVFPNAVTFVCILKVCGSIGAIGKGQEIHAKACILGLSESNVIVGNSLVDMYARCGMLEKAQKVFDTLPHQDIASWNALITGYAQNECGVEALACLKRMQLEEVPPDAVTFVCSLKACGSIGYIEEGANFENEIFRKGLLCDVVVANALVNFYAKSGAFLKAHDLFSKLHVQDVVTWTTIMGIYVNQDQGAEALSCLEQMHAKGVSPDAITYVYSLKSCGITGAIEKGNDLYAKVVEAGMLRSNPFVCSALVDMYLKCGHAAKAQVVFDNLLVRDVVLWTSLLAGYADNESCVEALHIFARMESEGISPDFVTYMCALKACGVIGAAEKGAEIHAEIAGKGLLENDDPSMSNALVSIYAKWGFLPNAQDAFDKLLVRDVNSWNALILGYAQGGEVENVFHIFNRLKAEGETPNLATFTGVIKACNCVGLVNKGKMFFEVMSKEHDISPTLEHHTCMIDLLNHTGYLDKGAAMIRMMPFHADLAVWHTILKACHMWGDVDFGKMAFEHALRLGRKDAFVMANRHVEFHGKS